MHLPNCQAAHPGNACNGAPGSEASAEVCLCTDEGPPCSGSNGAPGSGTLLQAAESASSKACEKCASLKSNESPLTRWATMHRSK